jgi:glycine dehydrogenase subunit 1
MSLLGEAGLTRLAKLNHARAVQLSDALTTIPGVECVTPFFFNEFTLKLSKPAVDVADALGDRGIIGGVRASRLFPHEPALTNHLIVAATEMNTDEDIAAFAAALKEVL